MATVIDFATARTRLRGEPVRERRHYRKLVTHFRGVRAPAPCTLTCGACSATIWPKALHWSLSGADGSLHRRCDDCGPYISEAAL